MNGIAWSPASSSTPGISCGVGTGAASAEASISVTSAITAVSFGSASSSRVYHRRASEVLPRLSELTGLVQRLAIHDLPTHVTGHLRELRPTDLYRALGLPPFAVLVRQRCEVPTGILLEFFLQLPQPVVIHLRDLRLLDTRFSSQFAVPPNTHFSSQFGVPPNTHFSPQFAVPPNTHFSPQFA